MGLTRLWQCAMIPAGFKLSISQGRSSAVLPRISNRTLTIEHEIQQMIFGLYKAIKRMKVLERSGKTFIRTT